MQKIYKLISFRSRHHNYCSVLLQDSPTGRYYRLRPPRWRQLHVDIKLCPSSLD